MKVQSCVVWIGMAVPATLPSAIILVRFDVVEREISRGKPANIDTGSYDGLRILSRVNEGMKKARFVGVWIEFRLHNECLSSKVTVQEL